MKTMEQWHRRPALTLASQLPDDVEDALLVIEAAREFVETFLKQASAEPLPDNVLTLRK